MAQLNIGEIASEIREALDRLRILRDKLREVEPRLLRELQHWWERLAELKSLVEEVRTELERYPAITSTVDRLLARVNQLLWFLTESLWGHWAVASDIYETVTRLYDALRKILEFLRSPLLAELCTRPETHRQCEALLSAVRKLAEELREVEPLLEEAERQLREVAERLKRTRIELGTARRELVYERVVLT